MIKHLVKYFTGKDGKRIDAVNENLLYPSTPPLKSGILYLDGEGTASGYIARRGAELFLSGEFNAVAFTGSRVPAKDWKSKLVFPRLDREGVPRPASIETEAQYMSRLFINEVEPEALEAFSKRGGVFHLIEGGNTGEKIRNFRTRFNGGAAINAVQAVTLVYCQRRVHGTFRQEIGESSPVSVEGVYPLGITKENWDKWALSYGVVMDEADKSGPRFDGKVPTYRRFFQEIDPGAETARILAFNP